jgi:DNA polymerase zeta
MSLGVISYRPAVGVLSRLYDQGKLHVSPNGVMYCTSSQRQGLLARMLDEILQTRVMVKRAMKGLDEGTALYRLLNSRQVCLLLHL